jgi:predicted NodU family carbamoyl transferase
VPVIKEKLIQIREDGSLRLNQEFFGYCDTLRMTNGAFDELFGGPPREPETKLTQRDLDLARSIQEVTEESMLKMADFAHRETGSKRLCLAGGVALNCVGNGRLLREGPFDEVWIQPAAGDAGGSLGIALAIWHRYLGKERKSPEALGNWEPYMKGATAHAMPTGCAARISGRRTANRRSRRFSTGSARPTSAWNAAAYPKPSPRSWPTRR